MDFGNSVILAEGWDIGDLVVLLALVVLSVIGGLMKKAREKYDEHRGRKMEEELDRERGARVTRPPVEEASAPAAASSAPARRGPPPVPVRQPQRAGQLVQPRPIQARRLPPVSQPVQPRAVPPRPVPPVPAPSESPGQAEQRLGHLRSRVVESVRQAETRHVVSAGRSVGMLRQVAVVRRGAPSGPPVRRVVNLSAPAEAVRAILYAEILGLPKAMRGGPESWER